MWKWAKTDLSDLGNDIESYSIYINTLYLIYPGWCTSFGKNGARIDSDIDAIISLIHSTISMPFWRPEEFLSPVRIGLSSIRSLPARSGSSLSSGARVMEAYDWSRDGSSIVGSRERWRLIGRLLCWRIMAWGFWDFVARGMKGFSGYNDAPSAEITKHLCPIYEHNIV